MSPVTTAGGRSPRGGLRGRGGVPRRLRAKGWCVGSASSARLSPAVPSHAADDVRMNLFLPGCRGAGPGGLCGRPRRVLRCQSCSSMRACCWGWRWTRDRLLAVHLDDCVPDSALGAFGEGRSVVVPAGPPGCASSRGGQRAGVPARRDHGDPAAAGRDRAGGRAVPAWTPTLNSIRPPVGQPVDATRRLRAARGHRGATFDRLVLHQAAPGHRSRVAGPSRPHRPRGSRWRRRGPDRPRRREQPRRRPARDR